MKMINFFFMVVLLLYSQYSNAEIPDNISYQGYLIDPAGSPVDSTISMTFNIYSLSAGGAPLWSDTENVTVSKGLFSVQLGGGSFPANLFDAPIWLGVAVETDAEMAPRKAFDSSAYAFKADDALTLEGQSAASLDQSSHVSDNSNPHNVTAAQAGAADSASSTAHLIDIANPHSATAAQTGSADAAIFVLHTIDNAAHHLPYSDASAVAAMGAKTDNNALNHDRFTDADAVAAIKITDGAGSLLDADLVDGLQASEIIDAASNEVRTPISELPFAISQPGSYYLTGNLNGANGGIDITADNVSLDLMGFTISHSGFFSDYGIYFDGRSNITIRNGTVTGFPLAGIYQGDVNARFATIMDVQVIGNGTVGTGSTHSGIFVFSSNSHIERCTAGNNGGNGLYISSSSKLISNTANDNSGSYGLFAGRGSVITNNTVFNNTVTYAIRGESGSIISENTAHSNSATYAIYGNVITILKKNTAYNNTSWGIYGAGANSIIDNNIHDNNTSLSLVGGLRVGGTSRVVGNTLDGNALINIVVDSSGSTLKDNHVADSSNGIAFVGFSGNYYRNNTGSGNTTFINFGGTTQTNGGGNINF